MMTLDFTQAELKNLITHHVGNKLRDKSFRLTEEPTTHTEETKDFLLRYFLLPVHTDEFYEFTHSVRLDMNDVYSLVDVIFNNFNEFITCSKGLAKLLYEHPM